MRLIESIIDANHRAVAGDASAGLHPAEFADALPIVALTCIDPRLNAFFPNALGLPAEQFIWLRNAGNIITSSLSSTVRSLALACAVKGGREIAIIGHTDCQICKTTTSALIDQLKALGVERSRLPENLSELFGTFGSERQNIIKACDLVRQSPLIGPQIPVHGLLLDVESGQLDWVVNGYDTLVTLVPPMMAKTDFASLGALGSMSDFIMGEMKFPDTKIGEVAAKAQAEIRKVTQVVQSAEATASNLAEMAEKHWPRSVAKPSLVPPLPPKRMPGKAPVPPPIRPRPTFPK